MSLRSIEMTGMLGPSAPSPASRNDWQLLRAAAPRQGLSAQRTAAGPLDQPTGARTTGLGSRTEDDLCRASAVRQGNAQCLLDSA
eukprot:5393242-Alexandrium_andersonii.AAC.1